jgi:hypothetical protein
MKTTPVDVVDLSYTGSVPAQWEFTKDVENTALAIMGIRNRLYALQEELDKHPHLTLEWLDFLTNELQSFDGNIETKYEAWRARYKR